MEPDAIERIADALFSVDVDSVAGDYLAFFAERVPENIADQLHHDGLPDIDMPSSTVDAGDLALPLSSGEFPAQNLLNLTSLLGYMIFCYESELEENRSKHSPHKLIYAGSLYLYCFISAGGVPEHSGYLACLRMMATVSLNMDVQSRLQVSRFLAALAARLPLGATDEPAPLSGLLLTLSLVVASVLSDLSVFAEHTMRCEDIAQEWGEDVGDEEVHRSGSSRTVVLKHLLLHMFGESGKVRQAAMRLLAPTEGGKR